MGVVIANGDVARRASALAASRVRPLAASAGSVLGLRRRP
jgi:hypothetical protein